MASGPPPTPGEKEEIRCEWILDESFIRLTWKTGAESREEFHGIDPTTGSTAGAREARSTCAARSNVRCD